MVINVTINAEMCKQFCEHGNYVNNNNAAIYLYLYAIQLNNYLYNIWGVIKTENNNKISTKQ